MPGSQALVYLFTLLATAFHWVLFHVVLVRLDFGDTSQLSSQSGSFHHCCHVPCASGDLQPLPSRSVIFRSPSKLLMPRKSAATRIRPMWAATSGIDVPIGLFHQCCHVPPASTHGAPARRDVPNAKVLPAPFGGPGCHLGAPPSGRMSPWGSRFAGCPHCRACSPRRLSTSYLRVGDCRPWGRPCGCSAGAWATLAAPHSG